MAGSISARRWAGNSLAMNSARRGQPALPLRHHLVHLHDPRRREGAGKRGGRARGKGEARGIVELEIALDVAVGVPPIGEVQHVVMIELVDERRIVNLHELLIAVVVGQRDEQVEQLAGRQQRALAVLRRAHRGHGVVHQAGHHAPVERRPEPARAHEQRQFLPHLQIGDGLEPAGRARGPEQAAAGTTCSTGAPAPRPRAGRRHRRS